jgi:hypothetical protein|tara:strand:- start:179 stop:406 length:228 start_codon:yes stop_codon:yes gene_type:complete
VSPIKPGIDPFDDAKLLDLKFSVLCYFANKSPLPGRGRRVIVDAGTEHAEYATLSCQGSLYKSQDFSGGGTRDHL